MSKNILIMGAVGIVVLGGIYFFFQSSQQPPQPSSSETSASRGEEMMGEEMEEMMEDDMMNNSSGINHVVAYSDSGYAPKELTIKKGDKVTFRNESARETWPASAMHPSHTGYPGSSIGKCNTPEENQIFDACRGLKQGEEWSFVFGEQGEWFYHDHLRPDMFGKIMVQE